MRVKIKFVFADDSYEVEEGEMSQGEDLVTSELTDDQVNGTDPVVIQSTDPPNCKKRKNARPKRFIPPPARRNLRNPPSDSASRDDPSIGRTVFGMISHILIIML
jgi:hypothetical protein